MASEKKVVVAGTSKPPRPISTTSSQLSISDRMTDGDEEDNASMRLPTASSCSSEVDQPPPPKEEILLPSPQIQEVRPPSSQRQSLNSAKTTTLSTIAMESNTAPPGSGSKCSPTRLVIALLQTPHRGLQLKVIELNPPLLKLPDNYSDAEDFLKNHNQVIKNLQSKQSPVEELLRQADNLIATQKPRAEVYAAMADSLGQTWKDLNLVLEERRLVIQLAFNAHTNISDCLKKMDDVHAYYSRLSYLGGLDFDREEGGPQDQLKRLKADRAEILRHVATCLESCDQLVNKISEYNYTIDSRELVLVKDVEFATRQVHRWLERLHDRRIILEERLRNKKEQLEELSDNSKYDQEIREVVHELEQCISILDQFNFGDSVPSAKQRKEHLSQVEKQLKILQEKAVSVVKRLEDAEHRGVKFSQRYGLKTKIYEILSQINDLLTEAMDLDLALSDAIEFFQLGDEAKEKLDSFSSTDPDPTAKTDLNKRIYETLAKGEAILQAYGWDSPKTKGVRAVHDSLLQRKEALLEELEHLAVLDEYNHFLESVNQTYQNILNIETSTIRQQVVIPVDSLESVYQFKTNQEKTLEDVRRKLGLDTLMSKLQNIYPDLSEEEKCGSETKINEVKTLSNRIVQLLLQRMEIATDWAKILEVYRTTREQDGDRNRILSALNQIVHIQKENVQPLLDEIHKSDLDLATLMMEQEIERIIKDLSDKSDSFLADGKIRDVCHKYKVKLDHHLLGDGSTQQGPQYYPVLSKKDVAHAIKNTESKVSCINLVIHKVIKPKLENALVNFFQPLLTSYREEILDIQHPSSSKTQHEIDLERYCDRLKESYVTVTAEIESYLSKVSEICLQVEQREELTAVTSSQKDRPLELLQQDLEQFDKFREEISDTIRTQIGPKFDHLLHTIRHEEPPKEGEVETDSLRSMMAHLGHDQELDEAREHITGSLQDRVVHHDLDLITTQLQHLIRELETPASYGNSTDDADENIENYRKFESTVQTLQVRLRDLLSSSGIPDSHEKVVFVKKLLVTLDDKRKERRDLIILSKDYFRLIEESLTHYESVNKMLGKIREESEDANLQIEDIEKLLDRLKGIKKKESEQEGRLEEIIRISQILFASTPSDGSLLQHEPLKQRNINLNQRLIRVEVELLQIMGALSSKSFSEDPSSQLDTQPITEISVTEAVPPMRPPYFVPHPPISTGTHGKEHSIELTVIGEPLPTVQWYKGGECIDTSPEYIITFNNGRCKLMFDKLFKDVHEGIFSCQATNQVGDADTHIELQIFEKKSTKPKQVVLQPETPKSELNVEMVSPLLKTELKDDDVSIGDTIGDVKDTTIASSDTRKESIVIMNPGGDATASIQNPTDEDVEVMEKPYFKTIIQDQMITAGDKFEFLVELEDSCDPSTELIWLKNNKKIEPRDGIEFHRNGKCYSLILKESKLSDKGNYLAKAINAGGDAKCFGCLIVKENLEIPQESSPYMSEKQQQHGAIPVTMVRSEPLAKPARFAIPLEGRMVDEGAYNVVLKCVVEAHPPAQIHWTKNNGADSIPPSPNLVFSYNQKSGDVQLELKKVSIGDAGRYSCTATNASGVATSVCDLVVKKIAFPPVFSKRLQSLSLDEGKRLYLEVDVYGKPSPDIVWHRNGTKLCCGDDVHIRTDTPTRHVLIIPKVVPHLHDGEYRITAKNEAGEASSVCNITVIPNVGIKAPPPPLPPKPKISPSPEPKLASMQPFYGGPFTTTLTHQEYSSFESGFSKSTSVHEFKNLSPLFNKDFSPAEPVLEPEAAPEILIAPSPTSTQWKKTRNQVQEKVKTFEVKSEMPESIIAPPSGGVKLLPLKDMSSPSTSFQQQQQPKEPSKVVELPIYQVDKFPFAVPEPKLEEFQIPTFVAGQPKQYSDSYFSKEEIITDRIYKSSASSSKQIFTPSKFELPDRTKESDYESDYEISEPMPVKWTPRGSPMSPTFTSVQPPPVTTSAFASFKPDMMTSSSVFSSEKTFTTTADKIKPAVPPKPFHLPSTTAAPTNKNDSEKVRQLVRSWPPAEVEEPNQGRGATHSSGLLSPLPREYQGRSPTPSKDALEMEKLWSKPLRFKSPTKFDASPIASPPPPMSPIPTNFYSRSPPRIAPKPAFSTHTPRQLFGTASPTPYQFQPPSTGLKSPEPQYYVSVVSTPRTTPIPGPFSPPFSPPPFTPTPEPPGDPQRSFKQMKNFFEQTSSYSAIEETTSSSYQKRQSSSMSSSSFSKQTLPPMPTLLESSFLPPPGEAPEYLFAPLQTPSTSISPRTGKAPFRGSDADPNQFSSSTKTEYSSSMMTSSYSSSTTNKEGRRGPGVHEIRVIPPTPPATTPSVPVPEPQGHSQPSRALVPYIKPSKFTPKLDFASSLDSDHRSYNGDSILNPTWNPRDEKVTMTTWKRVSYDPPTSTWRVDSKPRRNSLTILVDERMHDLNKKFKDNISLMTQGLCYNKLDRKVASQFEPSSSVGSMKANCVGDSAKQPLVEANPLIYFKYDFGYEFGIADPTSVIVRAASEPRENFGALPSSSSSTKKSYIVDETGVIHLPIIHEKSGK
ncbi:uncharacterized protein LOC110861999 isoform X1 [Folsomia candida]|uniref:uncharacterized protein LOC110861999 isoform X1 n=1 Tax=Folsomia candida TaxID=158441 RepID=UPI000B8FEB8F|nr:uncharacterized protein LOC110861999 isoform X1 [Folsomia candida]